MAAAEARAAWQRAANRCMVQEDRKRAPKLACCPLSSEQQHGTDNGNCTTSEDRRMPNFAPLSCNPINTNLPQDVRWWLQLQPNFRVQKDLASEQRYSLSRELGEKAVEDSEPTFKHEEPLHCKTVDTNHVNSEDVFEPPWMMSTTLMKHSSETGSEETIGGYSEVPLKCRGNVSISNCLYEDKNFMDSKSSGSQPPGNPQKANFDIDAPCKEGGKAQPWWQITDENELASLVAERAMQHIENCDLPRPTQSVRVHGTGSHNHENMGEYAGPSCPAGIVSHSYPGQFEHIQFSYSSTDELDLSNDGVWQRQRNNTYSSFVSLVIRLLHHNSYSGAHVSSRHRHAEPESKESCQNPSERAQLLEALRHSQTRAREAEMAAKEAYNEKDDTIKLLLRQASHLFACKQWLKILQLESICLQLKHKHKGHHISTLIGALPWMALKEKLPAPGQDGKDWTRRKGKRQKKRGGFCNAILFAVGLGLAGAGLLLGWTLGWLLPTL